MCNRISQTVFLLHTKRYFVLNWSRRNTHYWHDDQSWRKNRAESEREVLNFPFNNSADRPEGCRKHFLWQLPVTTTRLPLFLQELFTHVGGAKKKKRRASWNFCAFVIFSTFSCSEVRLFPAVWLRDPGPTTVPPHPKKAQPQIQIPCSVSLVECPRAIGDSWVARRKEMGFLPCSVWPDCGVLLQT